MAILTPRVILDMDGILADLGTAWIRRYNQDWHDTLEPTAVTAWELHHFVRPECGTRVYRYLSDPSLYREVAEMPGAREAVQRMLRQHRWDVVVVTAAPAAVHAAKAAWLARHIPELDLSDRLIFARRKDWVVADGFVDDAPHNLERYHATHPGACLATLAYPYNTEVSPYATRCPDWPSLLSVLEEHFAASGAQA